MIRRLLDSGAAATSLLKWLIVTVNRVVDEDGGKPVQDGGLAPELSNGGFLGRSKSHFFLFDALEPPCVRNVILQPRHEAKDLPRMRQRVAGARLPNLLRRFLSPMLAQRASLRRIG
jgi:hypothetical protein